MEKNGNGQRSKQYSDLDNVPSDTKLVPEKSALPMLFPSVVQAETGIESIHMKQVSSEDAKLQQVSARLVGFNPNHIDSDVKRPLLGILLSFLSCLFYSLTAVVVKGLKPVSGSEILVIRGAIQMVIYFFLVWWFDNPFFGVPGHRIDLFIRGLLGSISLNFVYIAFLHISLGDATAIHNMSPIYVIFLASFILGEPITCLQLLTAVICCLGAVFVARPHFIWSYFQSAANSTVPIHGDTFGFLMAFLCSIFSAVAFIWIRKLRQTPVYTVTFYYSILMSVVSAFFLPFTKKIIWPLDGTQWWKLLATGLFGTVDQICLTLSLKYENAGIISVSRTITIVMTYFWDVLFFDLMPPWTSLLGGGMIILSLIVIALTRPGAMDEIRERLGFSRPSESLPILVEQKSSEKRYS